MPQPRNSSDGLKRKLVVSTVISLIVLATAIFLLTRRPSETPQQDAARIQSSPARAAASPAEIADKSAKPADQAGAAETKAAGEAQLETPPVPLSPPLLHGRVTGEGVGIEGATVNLFSTKGIEQTLERLEELAPHAGEMPDIEKIIVTVREELNRFRSSAVTTKSGKDGAYEVRDVKAETYLALTLADGWLFHYGDVVSLAPERNETLDIALDRGASISGRVVNASGEGIPGADVIAEPRPAGMAGLGFVIRRLLKYVNGEFLKGPFETKTAADGSFTLASLPPGVYDIVASKLAGVEARLPQVETGSTEAVIYLGEPCAIKGSFADTQGAAAAGVPFMVERMDDVVQLQIPIGGMDKVANTVSRLISEGPKKAVSGPKGEVRLAPLAPGKYRLVVESRGLLPFERAFDLDWGQTLDLGILRLDRGAVIAGFVRGSDGSAIENAKVLATPAKQNFMNMGGLMNDFVTGRVSVATKSTGEFRLAGLVKGQYRLTVNAAGYTPGVLKSVETDGDPVAIDLKLGVRITGRVTSAEDEKPIAEAKVHAGECRAKTDAEGLFTLEGVSPKDPSTNPFESMGPAMPGAESTAPKTTVNVQASAQGFIAAEATIDLATGKTEVDVTLAKAPEVAGIVLDPDGKPAPGSLVRLTPVMPDAMPFDFLDSGMIFLAATVTDLDGKFRFSSLKGAEESSRYRVIADNVLYARGTSEPFDLKSKLLKPTSKDAPPSDSSGIEITLVRGVKVKGTVTDGTKPVPGATVRLAKAPKKGNGQAEQFGMFMNMLGLPKGGDLAYTAREGRFEYARLQPGDYVINAELAGFADSAPQSLTLAPGDEREVSLTVDPGGEIAGSVSDPAGTALANARVRLFREPAAKGGADPKNTDPKNEEKQFLEAQKIFGGSYKSERTAEDGSFRFQGLPAGTYGIAAEHPGYVKREVAGVSPGKDEQRIVLDLAASLAGIVTDSGSGQPITRFRVKVKGSAGSEVEEPSPFPMGEREFTDAEGRFVRDDLEAGPHVVKVSAEGYSPAREEVFLTSGRRVEKRFALVQAGRIRGVVLDAATQRPIAGARIGISKVARDLAKNLQQGAPESADSEARGRKRVEKLKSERAERKGGGAEDDPAAEDQRALGEHFMEKWAAEDSTLSGEDGSFLLEGVPPSPQRVFVTHPEYIPDSRDGLEVPAGEELQASFALRPGLTLAGKLRVADSGASANRFVFARGASQENAHVRKSSMTGAGGEFRLSGLEKGTYRLVVTPVNGKKARCEPAVFEVDQNQGGIEVTVSDEE